MKGKKILIAEDEEIMQITLSDALSKEGYEVVVAADGEAAWNKFSSSGGFDAVIADLKMPKLDGIQLLEKMKKSSPETLVIMITAYGTVETAVRAMKLGAYDYITKPFLIEELMIILEKAFQLQYLKRQNILLHQQLEQRYKLDDLIGKNKRMQEIFQLIETVAKGDTTVLIYGESGTGKELVANAIHHCSPRKNKPLVKVSCAALPESLLESELFGYEKGAFTGALNAKKGRFELADGGTLFLDDVDDMKPAVQVKLLRALQEGEFERVGGTNTIRVDVRVIAASKKNLEDRVRNGEFREDLFYRLNVVSIHMPPLRDRKDDIPLLVQHFIKKHASKAGKDIKRISPQALALMMQYDWPGNVRELENEIERAIALTSKDVILREDLYLLRLTGQRPTLQFQQLLPLKKALKEAEKEHIQRALEATKGKRKEAARILGISRKTLWEKTREHGIEVTGK